MCECVCVGKGGRGGGFAIGFVYVVEEGGGRRKEIDGWMR